MLERKLLSTGEQIPTLLGMSIRLREDCSVAILPTAEGAVLFSGLDEDPGFREEELPVGFQFRVRDVLFTVTE